MAFSPQTPENRGNLVAYWSILLRDGVHTVEFEHGSTSGKRVLRVDGQETLRRDWMFKLVGDEKFTIGIENIPCELRVDPLPNLSFAYSLYISGEPVEKFTEKQNRNLKSWAVLLYGKRYTIVFDKETLDVWIDGESTDTENEFTTTGSEMTFLVNEAKAVIKAVSVKKNEGVVYELYVDETLVSDDL